MRRRPPPGSQVKPWPRWYEEYRAADWPDGPQAWYDARRVWDEANPELLEQMPLLVGLDNNPPAVPWDGTGY